MNNLPRVVHRTRDLFITRPTLYHCTISHPPGPFCVEVVMAGVVLTGNPFADRPVQPVTAVAVVFVDGHVNAAQLQPQPR